MEPSGRHFLQMAPLAERQFSHQEECQKTCYQCIIRPESVGSSVAHQSDPLSSRVRQTANVSTHHLTNSSPLPGHQSSPTNRQTSTSGSIISICKCKVLKSATQDFSSRTISQRTPTS
ncbi:hypothetical protein LSTR_LSTR014734 [Laodelphax striatellus]|uniref:Uncharacterized protein n=1 Tax=Laodelphax striatellus TaxID=195883 RepID=A0A482WRL1_LAOST|nr:hypothetical protein LSTR_LSTR014734 [Laodelphax striatellus]